MPFIPTSTVLMGADNDLILSLLASLPTSDPASFLMVEMVLDSLKKFY